MIEVLVVVGVIAILAYMEASLSGLPKGAKRAAAGAMIKNLRQAMSEYESDYGLYPGADLATPPDGATGSTKVLVDLLDGDTSNGGPKKLYMDFKEHDITTGKVVDPWGNEYFYRVLRDVTTLRRPHKKLNDGVIIPETSKVNIGSYDLWSTGGAPGKVREYVTNF